METVAREDRHDQFLLAAARRGGRDSLSSVRLGEWWAELSQQEPFVSRHQEQEALRPAAADDDEAEGAMEWEDWGGDDHDGGGLARSDPASREAVAALRVSAVGETREQGCAVCLEDFVAGAGELRTMPCSHSFHRQCIFHWLLVQRRCPMCRFEMPSRTNEEDEVEE